MKKKLIFFYLFFFGQKLIALKKIYVFIYLLNHESLKSTFGLGLVLAQRSLKKKTFIEHNKKIEAKKFFKGHNRER